MNQIYSYQIGSGLPLTPIENQKIVDALLTQYKLWCCNKKMLEFKVGTNKAPTQDEFNSEMSHYLDKIQILEEIIKTATDKDIQEIVSRKGGNFKYET